jgi:hypothetical protein
MLLAVEGGEGFAGLGAADDDGGFAGGGPGDELVVEGVEGLAGLEHHVIGDVDHIVDAAQPDFFEGRLQPVRAGADFDAANDAGGVSGQRSGASSRTATRSEALGMPGEGWQVTRAVGAGRRIARRFRGRCR